MKKLNFWMAVLLFSAVVTVMIVKVNLKYSATNSKDFTLTNVEALAQGESGGEDCYGSGSVVCAGGLYKAKIVL